MVLMMMVLMMMVFKMKRLLLLTFLFTYFLNAESFYDNKCVDNYIVSNDNSFITIYYSNNNTTTISISNEILNELNNNDDLYVYDMQQCFNIKTDLLGLENYSKYSLLMGFYGIFLFSLVSFAFIKGF